MAANSMFHWSTTSAPPARRYDDLWFINPSLGWTVNSNGVILNTTDGGETWGQQHQVTAAGPNSRGVWLRCVSFANAQTGWVGTTSPEQPLFHTTDGGVHWNPVEHLPADAPSYICGLYVVNESVLYASGVNDPSDRSAAVMKSVDGGQTWIGKDMRNQASNLIDIYFSTPERGFVVGGHTDDSNPSFDNVRPIVLYTEDGGSTWVNRIEHLQDRFPIGTWGWKIQFINDRLGFISLENFDQAWILKTRDSGVTWERITVDGNANIEGVGFLNENEGWVGGWGDRGQMSGTTTETTDGGEAWQNANQIGQFINRFRFLGDPLTVGYSGGERVYKYAATPVLAAALAVAEAPPQYLPSDSTEILHDSIPIEYTLPEGVNRVTIHIWNRFAKHVRTLVDETSPSTGPQSVIWDGTDDSGERLRPGLYIYRLTVDSEAESRMLVIRS